MRNPNCKCEPGDDDTCGHCRMELVRANSTSFKHEPTITRELAESVLEDFLVWKSDNGIEDDRVDLYLEARFKNKEDDDDWDGGFYDNDNELQQAGG